jgi:hypothetical protein
LKEVELQDDDPVAMLGLLRHLYDLPYNASSKPDDDKRWDSLVSHAEVFVVAEKYQMQSLQDEICGRMGFWIDCAITEGRFSKVDDFVKALREIVSRTSDNNRARSLMVRICAMNLRELQEVKAFISLLKEFGSLGADIIGHEDLECGLARAWMCAKDCLEDDTPVCSACENYFSVERAWASRHNELWWCCHCSEEKEPICRNCNVKVEWTEGRGMLR